jgi:hypothetical protein
MQSVGALGPAGAGLGDAAGALDRAKYAQDTIEGSAEWLDEAQKELQS